jgi:hypothetical protein
VLVLFQYTKVISKVIYCVPFVVCTSIHAFIAARSGWPEKVMFNCVPDGNEYCTTSVSNNRHFKLYINKKT